MPQPTLQCSGPHAPSFSVDHQALALYHLNPKSDTHTHTRMRLQSMLSGFSAAFLGPFATGPFDVAKTRLMAQDRSGVLRYKVRHAACQGPSVHAPNHQSNDCVSKSRHTGACAPTHPQAAALPALSCRPQKLHTQGSIIHVPTMVS